MRHTNSTATSCGNSHKTYLRVVAVGMTGESGAYRTHPVMRKVFGRYRRAGHLGSRGKQSGGGSPPSTTATPEPAAENMNTKATSSKRAIFFIEISFWGALAPCYVEGDCRCRNHAA